nr:MAG TPA: hypothetical protein [Caudoviricetes sp.]
MLNKNPASIRKKGCETTLFLIDVKIAFTTTISNHAGIADLERR